MPRHISNGRLSERLVRAVKGLVNSRLEAENQEDPCRKLYLDLLVNTLCNVIYQDPSNDGPAERPFELGRREIGEDRQRSSTFGAKTTSMLLSM
jgi:hypothetical protein